MSEPRLSVVSGSRTLGGKADPRIEKLVHDLLAEYETTPVRLLDAKEAEGEYNYLLHQKAAYTRTLTDLVGLFNQGTDSVAVLEIGTFLGFVSLALGACPSNPDLVPEPTCFFVPVSFGPTITWTHS